MTKHYFAFGDIHGRLDLLEGLMKRVRQYIASNNVTDYEFVFLGDYVDRGPDSKGVIEYLMALEETDPTKCLKGNHEDMFLNARVDGEQLGFFITNGGFKTLESYSGDSVHANLLDEFKMIPVEHYRWLANLPTWYETDTHYFVHAGVNPSRGLDMQTDNNRLWIRDFWLGQNVNMGKHVVHGHTPRSNKPELKPYRTNLDTGAYYYGVLSCGIFTPEQGGPIEVIQYSGKSG